jgi:hypothetical protein
MEILAIFNLIVAILIFNKLKKIDMTTEELIAKLDASAVVMEKVIVEIGVLKDAVDAQKDPSPELIASAERLGSLINTADDLNVDA